MNCKVCGAQLEDGMRFCNVCGAEQVEETPAYEQEAYVQPSAATAMSAELTSMASSIMTLGIVSLVLGWVTGIGGLICGIIVNKKVKEYEALGGEMTGKAKTGKILGLIGLILGIVFTAIIALIALMYCGICVCGVMGGSM